MILRPSKPKLIIYLQLNKPYSLSLTKLSPSLFKDSIMFDILVISYEYGATYPDII